MVEVEATNHEALLRHVLSLGDRAEILAPRPLREKAREVLAPGPEGRRVTARARRPRPRAAAGRRRPRPTRATGCAASSSSCPTPSATPACR